VVATPTDEFLAFIKKHGISFEQAASARQTTLGLLCGLSRRDHRFGDRQRNAR
jgi:hypothetical protein